MSKVLRAVSLFSNCGAGDLGYREAGFRFDVMAELDPRRLYVAMLNHPESVGVAGDLRITASEVVDEWRKRRRDERPALLAACPPCQGMSSARSRRGREADPDAGSRDSRNLLVSVIVRVAEELKPRVLVVENVPAFLRRQVRHPVTRQPISAAALLIDNLYQDYAAYPLMADLADFGVPQTRKRSFLTLVRRDEQGLVWLQGRSRCPYPRPTHGPEANSPHVTVSEALADLPVLDASAPEFAVSADPFHFVPVYNRRQYQLVAAIPPDTGGSAWVASNCEACSRDTDDLEAAVCAHCGARLPRPTVELADGTVRLVRGFRTSSYTRMKADRPAATVTTASGHMGSDRTLHPRQNRVLSPRECAILQTLPADFEWGDALARWGHTNVREMIGEAVPPAFTRAHGQALVRVLTGRGPAGLMSCSDPRVLKAHLALPCVAGP